MFRIKARSCAPVNEDEFDRKREPAPRDRPALLENRRERAA